MINKKQKVSALNLDGELIKEIESELSVACGNIEKVLAICVIEWLAVEDIDLVNEIDSNNFKYLDREYLVCTEDEAKALFNESCTEITKETELALLPDCLKEFYDIEKRVEYIRVTDGIADYLATYDGEEQKEIINDTTYFIYRTN